MDEQTKRDRKTVTGAGVGAIFLGILILIAVFLLGVLARNIDPEMVPGAGTYVMGIGGGLLMIGLGIGILSKSRICLTIATIVSAILLGWNIYVRVALGLGMKMIATLAIPLVAFIAMIKAFEPINRLKSLKSTSSRRDVVAPQSLEERLRELDSLREKGLISNEEHASKRCDILKQL